MRRLLILLSVTMLMGILEASAVPFRTADGWIWRNPVPAGCDFYSVKLINDRRIVVGGSYGIICRSVTGGETWDQAEVPEGFIGTVDRIVFRPGADTGFAVGSGKLLMSVNQGASWFYFPPIGIEVPLDICLNSGRIYLLTKLAERDARNRIRLYDPANNTWGVVVEPEEGFAQLTRLNYPYAWNSNRAFNRDALVVNNANNIVDIEPLPRGGFLMVKDTLICRNGVNDVIGSIPGINKDLHLIDENTFYVVGNHIWRSRNGGGLIEDLGELGDVLSAVDFFGAQAGYSVGTRARIVYTINNGNFWSNSLIRRSYVEYVRNVYFLNTDVGFLKSSDHSPMITYKTVNGGETWREFMRTSEGRLFEGVDKFYIHSILNKAFFLDIYANFYRELVFDLSAPAVIADSVTDFYFVDYQVGYYTTPNRCYRSPDGGGWWDMVHEFENTHLNAVFFVDYDVGYVGGDRGMVLKSEDGGRNWENVSVAGVDVNGLYFVSADTGFVAADEGVFFRTFNGGFTWQARNTGTEDDLRTLKFFNSRIGYVVTSEGFIATTDGGDHFRTYITPLGFEVGHQQKTPSLFVSDSTFSSFIYGRGENVLVGANYRVGVDPYRGYLIPSENALMPVYPNPFNAAATIRYSVTYPGMVNLRLFDLGGRRVGTLETGYRMPGEYRFRWIPGDLPSGTYMIGLEAAGGASKMTRAVFLK